MASNSKAMNALKYEVMEFAGTEIRVDPKTGQMSATDMGKAAGKLWGHYKENKQTKIFLEELSSSAGIPIVQLVHTIIGGCSPGTWVHPYVAIHFSMWISATFAIKVIQCMIKYLSGDLELAADVIRRHGDIQDEKDAGQVEELRRQLLNVTLKAKAETDAYRKTIREKEDKIDELLRMTNSLILKAEESKQEAEEAKKQRDRMENTLGDVKEELFHANDQLENITEALDDRVPKARNVGAHECLLIMSTPDNPDWGMAVARTQNSGKRGAISRIKRRSPNAEVLLDLDYQPNGKNLFIRIKEELGHLITYFNTKINLREGIELDYFLGRVRALHDQRFEVDNQ